MNAGTILLCFSFEADLVAAALIAPIGFATLMRVRHRDEILVGPFRSCSPPIS